MVSEKAVKDGLFCWIDILGFKESVTRFSSPERMKSFYRMFEFSATRNNMKHSGLKTVVPDESTKQINAVVMSDTIIIYSESVTPELFNELIIVVSCAMASGFCHPEGLFPFRGYITRGGFYIHHSVNSVLSGKIFFQVMHS